MGVINENNNFLQTTDNFRTDKRGEPIKIIKKRKKNLIFTYQKLVFFILLGDNPLILILYLL